MRTRFTLSAFMVLVAILLFSGVALASTGQSESSTPTDGEVEELKDELMEAIFDGDGTSAWESMTPEEQTLVVEAIKESFIAVSLDGDDALADGSSGCDAHTGRKRVVMTDDVWLWEYFSETHWCWDGTQITNDPNVARRGYEYQSFVKFVGHTNTSENGGEGDLSHYDYSRGLFKICMSPLKIICPVSSYPVIEKLQYYDGDTWIRTEQDS